MISLRLPYDTDLVKMTLRDGSEDWPPWDCHLRDDVAEWCSSALSSPWHLEVDTRFKIIAFTILFEEENDFILFKMRWS